jgi:dihydrofolate reductase
MRKIVAFNHVSADGYFATADGKMDWVIQDEEIGKRAAEGMSETGTVLFGRRTYEQFASFWPHALDESSTAPDPHAPGHRSRELKAMAVWLNEATKLVFSKSLKEATWKNTRLLRELDPREIEALKRQPGGDIIMFGSGSIASQLTQHGLIDEYQFVVSPLLLGGGRSLLSGVSARQKLELLEAKPFRAGNVMLRYAHAS